MRCGAPARLHAKASAARAIAMRRAESPERRCGNRTRCDPAAGSAMTRKVLASLPAIPAIHAAGAIAARGMILPDLSTGTKTTSRCRLLSVSSLCSNGRQPTSMHGVVRRGNAWLAGVFSRLFWHAVARRRFGYRSVVVTFQIQGGRMGLGSLRAKWCHSGGRRLNRTGCHSGLPGSDAAILDKLRGFVLDL
jgi:hypothetical protein